MSKNSSPGHQLSDGYDSYYDPDFGTQRSSEMHVPDKISVMGAYTKTEASSLEDTTMYMCVPERIIVAGDNKHIAGREQLPEIRLESEFQPKVPNYPLVAPPNILTVDEFPYPATDVIIPTKKEVKRSLIDQSSNGLADLNESSISAVGAPEEEVLILRRQVRHLSRRVLGIEQENQLRQQREIILYSVGVIYFVLKGLMWLHRHF